MKNLLMIVALLASFGVKADQVFECDMYVSKLMEGTPDILPGTTVKKGKVQIYNKATEFALLGKVKEDTISSGKLDSDGASVRLAGKDKVVFARAGGAYAIIMGTDMLNFHNCVLTAEN